MYFPCLTEKENKIDAVRQAKVAEPKVVCALIFCFIYICPLFLTGGCWSLSKHAFCRIQGKHTRFAVSHRASLSYRAHTATQA